MIPFNLSPTLPPKLTFFIELLHPETQTVSHGFSSLSFFLHRHHRYRVDVIVIDIAATKEKEKVNKRHLLESLHLENKRPRFESRHNITLNSKDRSSLIHTVIINADSTLYAETDRQPSQSVYLTDSNLRNLVRCANLLSLQKSRTTNDNFFQHNDSAETHTIVQNNHPNLMK